MFLATASAAPRSRANDGVLLGVVDAGFRLVEGRDRVLRMLGHDPGDARPLLELLADDMRPRLLLVARRVAEEVVLLARDGVELVARSAVVGEDTWILLFERPAPARAPERPSGFVGRASEIAEFERYLTGQDSTVMYVRGPMGSGKTELLGAFAARCDELGCPHFYVDARMLAPTTDALVTLLLPLTRAGAYGWFEEARALTTRRSVIFVDNVDHWQRLADQISARPCAPMPADCRIVVTARKPPERRWWEPAGRTPRTLELGPLAAEESEQLLSSLDVPLELRADVGQRSAGNPFCIVSLASSVRRSGRSDAATSLCVDFEVAEVAAPEHLEAAAIPSRVTEEVLAALLGPEEARTAFDAVKLVAFRDPEGIGLRMPPALRDALRARLRERSPARLHTLQRSLASHLAGLLEHSAPTTLGPLVDDFLDTLEDSAILQTSPSAPRTTARRAAFAEADAVEAAATRLVDARTAATLADRMRLRYATTYLVEGAGGPEAIAQFVALDAANMTELAEHKGDLELAAAIEALRRQTVLSACQHVLACLAWVTGAPGGTWARIPKPLFRAIITELVIPKKPAAWLFVQPEKPAAFPALPIPGSTLLRIGSRLVFHRSLANITIGRLLTSLPEGARTLHAEAAAVVSADVLIAPAAVREVLTCLEQPDRLAASPLAQLALVTERAGEGAPPKARASALKEIVLEAVDDVGRDGREHRERQVLEAVFLGGGGKHEKIAADLGLPYSTFRRYLARGLERVTETLRTREHRVREEHGEIADEQRVSSVTALRTAVPSSE